MRYSLIIGYDKENNKLQMGDICSFSINNKSYEGLIDYDESEFAFVFEMDSDDFPTVYMSKADFSSIEKICDIYSTIKGDRFEWYRETFNKVFIK